MARDWKPGDVAMVQRPNADGERAAVYSVGGTWWLLGEGTWTARATPARPLVVIDPEDREQIEALADAIRRTRPDESMTDLAAALRDLADPKPPKPEEPTGLGAVVVDRGGERWVRIELGAENPWGNADGSGGWIDYADIDAVEVLSQGVTP